MGFSGRNNWHFIQFKNKGRGRTRGFWIFFIAFIQKRGTNGIGKKELLRIDDKFKVYNKLNEVFIKNIIQIRKDWLAISAHNRNYFIIEVDTDKASKIYSFETYEEAEVKYFEKFKESQESNFVLTHIEKPNFKRLCIAYASYVLTKHDYLKDWNDLTVDVLKESIENENNQDLIFFEEYTKRNLDDQIKLIRSEINELKKYNKSTEVNKEGFDEWLEDIKEQLAEVQTLLDSRENAKGDSKRGLIKKILGI